MGDGYAAFWRHAHKSEPIVVYSVILGVLGACPALPPLPTPHWLRTGIFPSRAGGAGGRVPGYRKSGVCWAHGERSHVLCTGLATSASAIAQAGAHAYLQAQPRQRRRQSIAALVPLYRV